MIFKKNIVVSIVCLMLFTSLWSQNKKNEDAPLEATTAAKEKALAKHAYKIGDPYSAIYYYEKYLVMKPNDLEALQELAVLYELTRDYHRAANAYNMLYNSDKIKYELDLYHKAIMEKMSGEYEAAKSDLLKFQTESGKTIEKSFKNQVKVDIEGCDSALKYIDYPLPVEVLNAGKSVNNPHVEFGPFPLDSNHFLFGSLTSDTIHFYDNRYGHKQEQPVRIFYTAEKINNEWVRQESLDEINDPHAIMGKVIYSNNTNTYFFTKCKKMSKGETVCSIYSRKLVKGKLEEVKDLGPLVNLPGFTSTQPAVSYDSITKRETLYFASNRPGGKGNLDIYYTYYDNKRNSWKKPSNLGTRVNTSGTECTPFYSDSEKVLYYSSDGFPGMGGLDVFKSLKDDQNRTLEPVNLGFPINTSQDDLDFALQANGKSGFVVSNRPGGTPYMHETCCDDIFEFKYVKEVPFTATLDLLVANLNGDTLENGIVIMIIKDLKTGVYSKDTIHLTKKAEKINLKKNAEYEFIVMKDGYVSSDFIMTTKGMSPVDNMYKELTLHEIEDVINVDTIIQVASALELPKEVLKDTVPKVVAVVTPKIEEVAKKVEVVETKVPPKAIVPEVIVKKPTTLNLQYAFDKSDLTDADKQEVKNKLISYLNEHPNAKVVINSHTDSKGSAEYNLWLSEERVKRVVEYLISQGIDESRLVSKGFGETALLVKDTYSDGRFISANCQKNRRTEVEIID